MHIDSAAVREVLRAFAGLVAALERTDTTSAESAVRTVVAAHEPWQVATETLRVDHRDSAWHFEGMRLPTDAAVYRELQALANRLAGHGVVGFAIDPLVREQDWFRIGLAITRSSSGGGLPTEGVQWIRAPRARSPGPVRRRFDPMRMRATVRSRLAFAGLDSCRLADRRIVSRLVRAVAVSALSTPVAAGRLDELLNGDPSTFGRAVREAAYVVGLAHHARYPLRIVEALGVAAMLRRLDTGAGPLEVLARSPREPHSVWLSGMAIDPALAPNGLADLVATAARFDELTAARPDRSTEEALALLNGSSASPWGERLAAMLTATPV